MIQTILLEYTENKHSPQELSQIAQNCNTIFSKYIQTYQESSRPEITSKTEGTARSTNNKFYLLHNISKRNTLHSHVAHPISKHLYYY